MIPTDVTLSGSATDVWIFQIAQDLTMSSDTNLFLIGGPVPRNVFCQVSGLVDSTPPPISSASSDRNGGHAAYGCVGQQQTAGVDGGRHRRQHRRRTRPVRRRGDVPLRPTPSTLSGLRRRSLSPVPLSSHPPHVRVRALMAFMLPRSAITSFASREPAGLRDAGRRSPSCRGCSEHAGGRSSRRSRGPRRSAPASHP